MKDLALKMIKVWYCVVSVLIVVSAYVNHIEPWIKYILFMLIIGIPVFIKACVRSYKRWKYIDEILEREVNRK